MPAGPLATFLLLLAEAASGAGYGPPDPPAATPASVPAPPPAKKLEGTAERSCPPANSDPKSTSIIICAPKPDGYRINPDVLAVRRLKKEGLAGRPRSPHETYADHNCGTIGPMGCRGTPAINLMAAALTAVTIANRLAKGEEVGSLFVTEPTSSDYQLYQQAKKDREAKAAAKLAAEVKAAALAKAAAKTAANSTPNVAPTKVN